MNGVVLAYAGVHQIFQLALAAHEMGELDGLLCAIVDGPGKWGRRLGKLVPFGTARPLGADGIPSQLITEYPWPMLLNRLGKRFIPGRHSDHLHSSRWFDQHAARWLRDREARVFVGGETCALESLRAAKSRGMACVLDCPGVPAEILDAEAQLAAADFGVNLPLKANSPAMEERKQLELAAADLVLCCSEFQRSKLVKLNPQVKRSEVLPLWSDVDFWSAAVQQRQRLPDKEPLRVLCAGAVSLKKGVPYLLQAVESLQDEVTLTLVGGLSPEMPQIMKNYRQHAHLPYVTKQRLREIICQHDVLVMPTLGDSFGFVVIEAMAAGMPVIVSQNAGAPVPDESWRVPVRDAQALRQRLLTYARDRELLHEHSRLAAEFAAQFQPARYRQCAGAVFKELLAA